MLLKCRTDVMAESFRCEWTIDNFSSFHLYKNIGEVVMSPEFSSEANDKLKWSLMLYPRGVNVRSEHHLSLYLKLMRGCGPEANTTFGLSILKANGEQSYERFFKFKFNEGDYVGEANFLYRSYLYDENKFLLLDDKLTIVCDITVRTKSIKASGDCIQIQVPECSHSKDFGRLFENHDLSDVILCTPSKEYNAHKAILAARSPVFAAMFRHEMEEKKSNRVDIADVGEEVLEEVLRYMYTGKAPNLDKMADKLLIAADKYDMRRLKALCEKSLCDNLAVGNAVDVLVFADLHGVELLKKKAIFFINRYLAEITETAGWEKMLCPQNLFIEVFRASLKALTINKDEKEEIKDKPSESNN